MTALSRRIRSLEATQGVELSPGLKQWLGRPITDEEREALAAEKSEPVDLTTLDTRGWSKEMKAWLGVA